MKRAEHLTRDLLIGATGRLRPHSVRFVATVCLVAVVAAGQPLRAAEPAADPISAAEKAMHDSDFAKAATAWREAQEKHPNIPELVYNEGVALYRNKEYTRAAEQFSRTLANGRASLEERTKFNLGNCEYSQAILPDTKPEQAEEHLKAAIRHYRDALTINPADNDARVNLELAARLLKVLMLKKQQSSQPDQNQQQQDQNPSSQPKNGKNKPQPSSQKSQPSTQPDKQDQQKPSSQPDDQQKQQDSQQNKSAQSQPASSQPAGQAEAEMKKMSKEEAERLLQMIRDKEQQRREQKLREMRVRRRPVEKDW